MYKIQTLNKISSKGLNHFPLDNYEVASDINNPDAIQKEMSKEFKCAVSAICKALKREGITRKKRLFFTRKKT